MFLLLLFTPWTHQPPQWKSTLWLCRNWSAHLLIEFEESFSEEEGNVSENTIEELEGLIVLKIQGLSHEWWRDEEGRREEMKGTRKVRRESTLSIKRSVASSTFKVPVRALVRKKLSIISWEPRSWSEVDFFCNWRNWRKKLKLGLPVPEEQNERERKGKMRERKGKMRGERAKEGRKSKSARGRWRNKHHNRDKSHTEKENGPRNISKSGSESGFFVNSSHSSFSFEEMNSRMVLGSLGRLKFLSVR